MSNRHQDMLVVYSPKDFQTNGPKTLESLYNMAKEHTELYSISNEFGEKGTHHHLDCVFRFKNKQAKADIKKKLKNVFTNDIEFRIGKITDWKYRLGYNIKEQKEVYSRTFIPENVTNISQKDLDDAYEYYKNTDKERDVKKQMRERFKFTSHKQFLYILNQYLLKEELSINSIPEYWDVIHVLEKQGYYFDFSHNKHMDFCRWLIQFFSRNNRTHRDISINSYTVDEQDILLRQI